LNISTVGNKGQAADVVRVAKFKGRRTWLSSSSLETWKPFVL